MIAYVIHQPDWPAVGMVWCGFATPILRIFSQRKPKAHPASKIHRPSVRIPKVSAE